MTKNELMEQFKKRSAIVIEARMNVLMDSVTGVLDIFYDAAYEQAIEDAIEAVPGEKSGNDDIDYGFNKCRDEIIANLEALKK